MSNLMAVVHVHKVIIVYLLENTQHLKAGQSFRRNALMNTPWKCGSI